MYMALSKEEKLAREIADALEDMDSYAVHLSFVQKYFTKFKILTFKNLMGKFVS